MISAPRAMRAAALLLAILALATPAEAVHRRRPVCVAADVEGIPVRICPPVRRR